MSDIRILTPDNPTGQSVKRTKILTPEDSQVDYQPQWAPWMRQFVAFALLIGSLIGIILLGPIAQILIGAFLLALVMYFPARFVKRRTRLTYKPAVGLLYLFLLASLLLAILLLIPAVSQAVTGLTKTVEQQVANVTTFFNEYSEATPEKGFVDFLGTRWDLNPILTSIDQLLTNLGATRTPSAVPGATIPGSVVPAVPIAPSSDGSSSSSSPSVLQSIDFPSILTVVTGILAGIFGGVTGFLSTFILSLFISFLILIELPSYQRGLYRLVPSVHHREMALLNERLINIWQGFFRGQLIVGLIIGVLTWGQCMLMGVQGALPLAILVAVISLIPNIGGFIALVPLALGPLIQGSTVFTGMSNSTFALLVLVVNLLISQVIWNVVAPSIIGDALSLPLPVIIVGVFFGAAIGGIIGAFLIAPILGSLKLLVMYLLAKVSKQDPFPGEVWEPQTV